VALRATAPPASAPVTRRSRSPSCRGTAILLDSASPPYAYLNGQGALRAYQQGTDDVSHAAISNLVLSNGRNFRVSEAQVYSEPGRMLRAAWVGAHGPSARGGRWPWSATSVLRLG
jgi:hypothetical protein